MKILPILFRFKAMRFYAFNAFNGFDEWSSFREYAIPPAKSDQSIYNQLIQIHVHSRSSVDICQPFSHFILNNSSIDGVEEIGNNEMLLPFLLCISDTNYYKRITDLSFFRDKILQFFLIKFKLAEIFG